MTLKAKMTEHNGAKNGGGYWGKRTDAKQQSSRARRIESKKAIQGVSAAFGSYRLEFTFAQPGAFDTVIARIG